MKTDAPFQTLDLILMASSANGISMSCGTSGEVVDYDSPEDLHCPMCGKEFRLDTAESCLGGNAVKCPSCKQILNLGAPSIFLAQTEVPATAQV